MLTENYRWGRYHRALIARHAKACRLNAHDLARLSGYTNVDRFQRRRAAWSNGEAARKALIPVAFLEAIGVDAFELALAVERDAVEYKEALKQLPVPESFVSEGRAPLGIRLRTALPQGLSEDDAIRYVQGLVDSGQIAWGKALIDWPGMKSIWIYRFKRPGIYTWTPVLLSKGDRIGFGAPASIGSGFSVRLVRMIESQIEGSSILL